MIVAIAACLRVCGSQLIGVLILRKYNGKKEGARKKGRSKSRPVYGKAGHMACTLTRGAYLIHTFA